MLPKTLLVVSNKFHNFATRADVITVSELYSLLSSDKIKIPYSQKIMLIPGQGFSRADIDHILALSVSAKNASAFNFSLWRKIPQRASSQLTHKHKTENILVSEPSRRSDSTFEMDVLIDENCEMMRDHQTGLHIQGMLLVEAARQAYLATMEKFYIENRDEKNYFIFNELNVGYNKFAFPLPSSILLTNEKLDLSNKKRQHTSTKIELLQCGEVSASVFMDVTIMPDNRVSTMENRFAKQSLESYMNQAIAEYDAELTYQEVSHA